MIERSCSGRKFLALLLALGLAALGLAALGLDVPGLAVPGLAAAEVPARSAEPALPSPPLGRWLSQDHDGVFDIRECGRTLCGRLIAMRYAGAMPTDDHGNPQCGLMMLTGFTRLPDDPSRWSGIILDPGKGRHYHAQIWSPEPGLLKLRGYLLMPLFGQTQRWTRYDGPIGPACHLQD